MNKKCGLFGGINQDLTFWSFVNRVTLLITKSTENCISKAVEEVLSNEEITAKHLRFMIKSGYDHFVAVHSVEVMGALASGRSPTVLRKPAR